MTTWTKYQLKEIVDIVDGDRGSNYPKQHEFYPNGYCLFLNTKNVPNTKFDFSEKLFINEDKDKLLRKGKLENDDYVLTTRGTIGNFAHYTQYKKYPHVRLNSGMVILRPKQNVLVNGYLQYILSSSLRNQINNRKSGSAQPQLPIRDMETMIFSIPDLPTQQKIANILSAYDDLIEINERRIKILEEMAQRLYTEWFVHFRFPGHEKVKLVDSHTSFGMIPERWEVMPIGEVITIMGGGTPSRNNVEYWENGDINWYTPTDLTKSDAMFSEQSSQKISKEGLQKSSAKLFPKYSVMMTSRATIGAITINTEESCTNQGFIICIPNEKLQVYYIYYYLKSRVPDFIDRASGATFKELSRGEFKKFNVLIPTQTIMEQFGQLISDYGDEILSLQKQIQRLTNLRDLLLPQLISGKREVK